MRDRLSRGGGGASITISITHFAPQSDGAQSISNIITWFPGGRLRLIDKPIHFEKKKKEQEEMKRPEDLRVFQKRGDHQRFSSNVTNPAQRRAAEIATKTVNDCHAPADHFCRLSGTRRTPASGVCVRAFVCVCVSVRVLIWIFYESVWKWPAECTHPRRIMETVDYFPAASKKRL